MAYTLSQYFLITTTLMAIAEVACEPDITVHTQQGTVRGTNLTSARSNRTFYAFMGIPYGKPPVGDLRFKPAEPAEPWDGVREAITEASECPQINKYTGKYTGEENCLFVNVFTPKVPESSENSSLNAVMVWIHPGGYVSGSGNRDYSGPDFLVDEGVVVVTFNYRLGMLGFLSLQNSEVPGNNGLKDQVLALKWVRQNINNFGGDPNRVTIFGQGSGANCVHFHLLSSMSRGLFHRAISQSGTPLIRWGLVSQNSSVEVASSLGKALGYNTTDSAELLKALRKAKVRDLVNFVHSSVVKSVTKHLVGPTLDTNAVEGEVFFPQTPADLTKQGKMADVPYIVGVNNAEGLQVINVMEKLSWFLEPVVEVFEKVLPYYVGESIPEAHNMAVEVKNKYFNSSEPVLKQYVEVVTDHLFTTQTYCIARKKANVSNSTVFSYLFTFNGTANVYKKEFGGEDYQGACHADELPYLFRLDGLNVTIAPNSTEYNTSKIILKLWSNFAKTGNPTPEADPLLENITWTAVSGTDFPYLVIDSDLEMKNDTFNGGPLWWERLYQKYTSYESPCWHGN